VDIWLNLQDTLLTFLFTALLGALIATTRFEASRVDEASARRALAVAEQARAEAEVREKSRLDSLVHDKVLTTLSLAAKAETPEQKHEVANLAVSAVTALNGGPTVGSNRTINGSSFFAALEKIALSQSEDLKVFRTELDSVSIPGDVATALTEAMLQAITNSQQHAGPNAIRELHLKGHRNGLKIVVKDTGRGFRMSRVPKNRLGVRISIIDRVEMVGGRVFINSNPGNGANIILEWGTSD
jgi:signal transduction histidine kinase